DSPSKQIITAMESDPELKPQADNLRSLFSKESKATDILFSIISNFILIYLVALYWHLILKSLQIALNGFEATLRVFCYSSVVLLTSFIPLSTPFLNFAIYIWWSFLMFIGISEAHEVSKKLALRGMTISLFATMIPFIFFVLLIF
ncbi:MAG: YIP1 family protein, partial [Candidatus Delongbacteria bacterium]|nr:YIP1 family protein [Candidatus Delongbacteria bacterium]